MRGAGVRVEEQHWIFSFRLAGYHVLEASFLLRLPYHEPEEKDERRPNEDYNTRGSWKQKRIFS